MKDLLKKISQALASVGLIFAVAMLGSVAGQGPKWLRRFILPLIVTIYAYFLLQNFWVLSCYLMAFPLSIGYGTVSPDDDKPSFLGKLAYKLFPKSTVLQNVFCRGIIGLLISISMLCVPIMTGKWITYLLCSVVIIVVWASLSWRNFGETKLNLYGKEINLLNVDLTVYAVTSCAILAIIHGFVG